MYTWLCAEMLIVDAGKVGCLPARLQRSLESTTGLTADARLGELLADYIFEGLRAGRRKGLYTVQ